MLHTKFRGKRLAGYGKEFFFEGDLPYMGIGASLVM